MGAAASTENTIAVVLAPVGSTVFGCISEAASGLSDEK